VKIGNFCQKQLPILNFQFPIAIEKTASATGNVIAAFSAGNW
jgi:hypothetical protein